MAPNEYIALFSSFIIVKNRRTWTAIVEYKQSQKIKENVLFLSCENIN